MIPRKIKTQSRKDFKKVLYYFFAFFAALREIINTRD